VTPLFQNGWAVYTQSRIHAPIPCGATPVQLSGDRLDTHMTGECGWVRITGAHNDIEVDSAPGGTIEVLGSNNDVFWRQSQRGAPPRLIDHGFSNTFHRAAS
jgi:hypothetical protein